MICLCVYVEVKCIFQALLLVYSGGFPGASPFPHICCGSAGYWVYFSSNDIIDPKARHLSRNCSIILYSITAFLPGTKKKWSIFVINHFDFQVVNVLLWSNELLNVSVWICRSGARLCLHVTLHQQQREGWLETKNQKQEKLQQQVLPPSFYYKKNESMASEASWQIY